jgi:hypothetical protein
MTNQRPGRKGMTRAQLALSALMSIFFLIPLIAHHDSSLKSMGIWLVYVVIAGAVIIISPQEPVARVLRYALVPTLTFLIGASFITWLGLFAETISICATCGAGPMDYGQLGKRLMVYLVIAPPTLVGITLGSYARVSLLDIYAKSRRVTVADLRGLQRKITLILSILGLVGAWVLAR